MIQRLLHGPKGNSHGALLKDGVIVRFPPHSAESFAGLLVIDAPLSVRGTSLTTAQGTVIDAEAMGKDPATLVQAAKRPAPGAKKPEKPEKLKKGPASKDHEQPH